MRDLGVNGRIKLKSPLQHVRCKSVEFIYLCLGEGPVTDLINTVMKSSYTKGRNLCSRWSTLRFSRRTVVYESTYLSFLELVYEISM